MSRHHSRLRQWHRKFAWLPVVIGCGRCRGRRRWLCFVERRVICFGGYFAKPTIDYREWVA